MNKYIPIAIASAVAAVGVVVLLKLMGMPDAVIPGGIAGGVVGALASYFIRRKKD